MCEILKFSRIGYLQTSKFKFKRRVTFRARDQRFVDHFGTLGARLGITTPRRWTLWALQITVFRPLSVRCEKILK